MNAYNYNHLFYFYIAAKLKGITVAAKHLNTSQSSLSMQIKTLESGFGRPLFKKAGRKIELTEFGTEVFNYCRRAFEVLDEMFDQLNKTSTSMGVRISAGVSVDIERPFVADTLVRVAKMYPKNGRPLLNLVSLPTPQLKQLLEVGEIDVLLTAGANFDGEFNIVKSFNLPVHLLIPKAMAANIGLKRSVEEIITNNKIPFVLPSKFIGLRSEIDSYFIRKKARPFCTFESNMISSVIRAATDEMGATILPLAYLGRELSSKRLIKVGKNPLWNHKIFLLSGRRGIDEGRKLFVEKLSQQLTEFALSETS